jgi:hypothetical protein
MKIDTFITCLGYYGISTGASTALEGAYALSSGTTGIFFNQLFSSGAHFVNGQIYAPTLPLINVYSNNLITNNYLSGANGLRVGYSHTGNFSVILDIEYSGCNRILNGKGMTLLSTAVSPSGFNSGFAVGITESNRLYFNTSGYSQTLDKELSTRDFVYIALAEQKYATIGIFSLNDNLLYKKNIILPSGTLNSSDIYIGNLLVSNPSDPYIGFSGKINQAIVFNDPLIDSDIGICANCSLTTGFNKVTNIYSFVAQQLTGLMFSGVMDSAITGYTNITGKVVTHDGSTINVITPSGMTGYFLTGQLVIPLFSGITLQNSRDDYAFQYDNPALNSFSTFSLYFDLALSSGDSIEVYTYPQPNVNIGKKLDGVNWPNDTGSIQLIANGLNETLGVDYYILRNQVSGYTTDDVLSYDVLVAPSIVTAYSGYWNDISRVQMSGGGFYPSAQQYFENTTNFSGIIKITGLSGICVSNPFYPSFGYDLHMNGQKLISGMHYNVVTSGTSGFVVSLSGNKLPQLIIYPIYDITGGGPIAIDSVDDSELAFIPEFSGFQPVRIDVTGDYNTFSFFTGFGEQVWVNGIRQLQNLDYRKILPCSMITGVYNPPVLDFIMYDSDAGNDSLWNISTPPAISFTTGTGPTAILLTGALSNINGYSTSGGCVEVWTSQLNADKISMNAFSYAGTFSSGIMSIAYTGASTAGIGTGVVLGRYHQGNYMGNWTMTPPIRILP